MKKRVVVTGLGLITPLGTGVEKSWKAICAGESGIDRITRFDPTEFSSRIAGEVKDFNPEDYIEKKEIKKMDTFIHFAVGASQIAVDDSGLKISDENRDRVGVYVGAGIGGLPAIEYYHKRMLEEGPKKISPFFIPMVLINLTSGQIAIRFGLNGPNSCAVTACSTGTHSIGDAYRIIQRGEADAMIAGGTEAAICPLAVGGFASMKALSTRNDEPKRASRPFDRERDGFVMGEGAGIVVMEELDFARKRGANIYCEIAGYGMNADAYHITAPSPQGHGAAKCIRLALDDAKMRPEDIGYVNAHATSTSADSIETQAIKTVFGEYAYRLPVSSTKSMTGHLLGAAGGIEAIFTILAIKEGILPPTINYEYPDTECDLDFIPNKARYARINAALSNSFGFGGTNASIIVKRFTD